MTLEQYVDWLSKEIEDAKSISDIAESDAKHFWNGKVKALEKINKKFLKIIDLYVSPSIVVYKNGTYIKCEDGVTWEFENDPDYLVTIR